jgi:diaminopimelate decarboxylase
MDLIKYRDKNLYFENVSVKKIAQKNITPFFLYSFKQLENNFKFFQNTFSKINPLICFAIKSNTNLVILNKLKKLGSGADVVSIGELQLALKAGIDPQKIVFSGVGKTKEELAYAISKKILLINTESENEIGEIIKIVKNKKTTVKFRCLFQYS